MTLTSYFTTEIIPYTFFRKLAPLHVFVTMKNTNITYPVYITPPLDLIDTISILIQNG